MATCVYGATMDTDRGDLIYPACTVHCCWAPCPWDGAPASTTPLEATDEQGQMVAIQFWTARTRKQRPLVLHRGSWADERDHSGRDYWCSPEFLEAVAEGSVHPGGET